MLCGTLVIAMAPAFVMAESGSGQSTQPSFTGSAFRDGKASDLIDPGAPSGYDENDDSNPFGYAKGRAFRIYEDSELFTYFQRPSWKPADSSIYDSYTRKDVDYNSNFLETGKWESVTQNDFKAVYGDGNQANHHAIQNVSFDPQGLGRKTMVGFIGIVEDDSGYTVNAWVYDALNKKASPVYKIGDVSKLITVDWYGQDRAETLMFQLRNFMSITAGDFDNDGKDTLVAYVASDDGPVMRELQLSESGGKLALSETGNAGSGLLHPKYMANLSYFSDKYNGGEVDGHDRLGCQLKAGDVNDDHIDDLIAVSYTNIIDEDAQKKCGNDIFEPFLAVKRGGSGVSASGGLFSLDGDHSAYVAAGFGTHDSKKVTPTVGTPTVTAAKLGSVSGNSIVVGGYEKYINYGSNGKSFDSVSYGESNQALFVFSDGDKLSFENNYIDGLPGALTASSIRRNERFKTWAPLMTTAVSINGSAAPDWIFQGGKLYSLEGGNISVGYEIPMFSNEVGKQDPGDTREVYISDVEPVCLTKVGGNYQSVAFTMGLYWHDNTIGPTGQGVRNKYNFKIGIAGPNISAGDLAPTSYYGDGDIGFIVRGSSLTFNQYSTDWADLTFCAVDLTDDGLMARFSKKDYLYTDAEVLAVLQAAPYFGSLGATPGSTEYTFGNEYEYSDETSTTKSGSVGFDAVCASEFVTANFKVGASYETRDWTENNTTTEYTNTFGADVHDSVIVFRTPVITYSYDIWDTQKNKPAWENNAMAMSYVEGCEYVQLSIDDYNKFVDEYNKEAEKREKDSGKKDSITRLEKLGSGLYLGNEGLPTEYYGAKTATQKQPENFSTLSKITHELGYDGGFNASEFVTGTSVTSGSESAQGFNISFEATVGFYGQVGAYESYEELKGHSISTTNTKKTGIKGQVTNIDLQDLVSKGMDEKTVRSYGFSWQPAKWDSNLSYSYKDKAGKVTGTRTVPVYGYYVSKVRDPEKGFTGPDENTLSVKGKTVKIKYSKLKKKAQKISAKKAFSFKDKGQGKLSYKKLSVNKKKYAGKFKVNKKTGQITASKGLKKGTYKLRIQVTAAGDEEYSKAARTVTVKIIVR